MTAGANEVRGHLSCTFVSISRILYAPSSSLTALALDLKYKQQLIAATIVTLSVVGKNLEEEFLVTIATNSSAM